MKADSWRKRKRTTRKSVNATRTRATRCWSLKSLAAIGVLPFMGEYQHYKPAVPQHLGVHQLRDYPLAALVAHIDWTPFFLVWDLAGNSRRFSMTKSSATKRKKCSATGGHAQAHRCRRSG